MRLPDSLLDDCLCDPSAPLGRDPARDYGWTGRRRRHSWPG